MEAIIDFQTFYQQTIGKLMEFVVEDLNEERTTAYVVSEHGDRFYIDAKPEWAAVLEKEYSVEADVICSKEETGENIAYEACLKQANGNIFSCGVVFYPNLKMVNIEFNRLHRGHLRSMSLTELEPFESFLGSVASFMLKHMIETDPACRLYFVTETIEVHSPYGISIPGYVSWENA